MDIDKTDISLASLDTAYVRAVKTARERQSFLRESLFLAQFSHTQAEPLLDVRVPLRGHWSNRNIQEVFESTDFKSH
jgi:hypothetical protein